MEKLLYVLGGSVCHQLSARSFFICNHQLPICMRCSGTYLGAIITFFIYMATGIIKRGKFPKPSIFVTILAFPFLMGVDVFTVNVGLRPANPEIKMLTGIFAGFFITSFLVPAFHTGFSGLFYDKELFKSFWFVLLVPPIFGVALLLTHIQWEPLFYITAILQNLSILMIFSVLNLFIFLTMFEKKYPYPIPIKKMLAFPIPFSIIFTITELSLFYLFRVAIIPPDVIM